MKEAPEATTHFWVELEKHNGVIDVYTNNPLIGDVSQYIESWVAHGGNKPECYNTVEKFQYYGQITPYDLCSKENFLRAVSFKSVEPA